jgi:hypothetical protein
LPLPYNQARLQTEHGLDNHYPVLYYKSH